MFFAIILMPADKTLFCREQMHARLCGAALPVFPDKVILIRWLMACLQALQDSIHPRLRIGGEVVKLHLNIFDSRSQSGVQHAFKQFVFTTFNVDLHQIDAGHIMLRKPDGSIDNLNCLLCSFVLKHRTGIS